VGRTVEAEVLGDGLGAAVDVLAGDPQGAVEDGPGLLRPLDVDAVVITVRRGEVGTHLAGLERLEHRLAEALAGLTGEDVDLPRLGVAVRRGALGVLEHTADVVGGHRVGQEGSRGAARADHVREGVDGGRGHKKFLSGLPRPTASIHS